MDGMEWDANYGMGWDSNTMGFNKTRWDWIGWDTMGKGQGRMDRDPRKWNSPSEFGIACGIMEKENTNVLFFEITFINCNLLTKIKCIILHINVDYYLKYMIIMNGSL